jgi:nickel/cobalt transporter (NicO) family protein
MRAFLIAVAVALAAPAAASAHPLGNFSVNHEALVAISSDRVDITYLLDQAEIPTFQERGRPPAEILAAKRGEALRGLRLEVDGRAVPLRAARGRILFLPGQGGLKTTRVELPLSAAAHGREVRLRDETFRDRVGYAAVVVRPGHGTAVRSSAPAGDPTGGLRRYPANRPPDRRVAHFEVAAGRGTVTAPRPEGGGDTTVSGAAAHGAGDGFAGLLAPGAGLSVLLLVAAFGWGAVHALSPGHGKAMVAAYLVGARGTPRHAVALGMVVTFTHTIGVFALGVVTLTLSAVIVPERLYPWLSLASGLLVIGVGLTVLRSRRRQRHQHHHHHHHDLSRRALLAMGASAGLLPCPSALVVLLAAIAQHQVALGLVLIVAFSAGLATTLTAAGLAVVASGRVLSRVGAPARLLTALPTASALVIVAVGCALTLKAV